MKVDGQNPNINILKIHFGTYKMFTIVSTTYLQHDESNLFMDNLSIARITWTKIRTL